MEAAGNTQLYWHSMKTAISVPDETFARASQRAKALGLSRSEFFARAADRYLDDLDAQSVTDQINETISGLEDLDSSSVDAVAGGRRVLAGTDDEW
jgi:predicted DNA-binding protein